jgi:hypothetical protein
MSFDLMLLDPDTVPTVEDIYSVLESDVPETPLSVRLQAVVDECHSRWPAYDAGGNEVEAPWASWPVAREAEPPVIEINIVWSHAATMLAAFIDIAQRYEVVLYDPQTGKLCLPARLT